MRERERERERERIQVLSLFVIWSSMKDQMTGIGPSKIETTKDKALHKTEGHFRIDGQLPSSSLLEGGLVARI